ncbi:uncharacterized protein LOC132752840 [Ruditapes philippinarum]|uniref:uncharacterized protein LOC132752840 n=1 Tax=Ruditapes philippinarum TaxID=129788 RepID=UPI00295B8DAC|nr:uncharacterized protein LOC132752840 [Ruditapes philippinarum]
MKTHVQIYDKPCTNIAEDYIRVICSTDKYKQNTSRNVHTMKSDINSESEAVKRQLISVASGMTLERNMVLFTVVNDAYMPFVNSWLCNTKTLNIHKSVLIRIKSLQENEDFGTFEEENEQVVLARLLRDGYGNETIKMLPLEMYADGKWYNLSEEDRSKTRPVIINNNWIVGKISSFNTSKINEC